MTNADITWSRGANAFLFFFPSRLFHRLIVLARRSSKRDWMDQRCNISSIALQFHHKYNPRMWRDIVSILRTQKYILHWDEGDSLSGWRKHGEVIKSDLVSVKPLSSPLLSSTTPCNITSYNKQWVVLIFTIHTHNTHSFQQINTKLTRHHTTRRHRTPTMLNAENT